MNISPINTTVVGPLDFSTVGGVSALLPNIDLTATSAADAIAALSDTASLVDLSAIGQLLSAVATYQAMKLPAVTTPVDTATTAAYTAAAQVFVDAVNNFQAQNSAASSGDVLGLPADSSLIQALNVATADGSGNTLLTALAKIGITYQESAIPGNPGQFMLDSKVFQAALTSSPAATAALLAQAFQALGQAAKKLLEQNAALFNGSDIVTVNAATPAVATAVTAPTPVASQLNSVQTAAVEGALHSTMADEALNAGLAEVAKPAAGAASGASAPVTGQSAPVTQSVQSPASASATAVLAAQLESAGATAGPASAAAASVAFNQSALQEYAAVAQASQAEVTPQIDVIVSDIVSAAAPAVQTPTSVAAGAAAIASAIAATPAAVPTAVVNNIQPAITQAAVTPLAAQATVAATQAQTSESLAQAAEIVFPRTFAPAATIAPPAQQNTASVGTATANAVTSPAQTAAIVQQGEATAQATSIQISGLTPSPSELSSAELSGLIVSPQTPDATEQALLTAGGIPQSATQVAEPLSSLPLPATTATASLTPAATLQDAALQASIAAVATTQDSVAAAATATTNPTQSAAVSNAAVIAAANQAAPLSTAVPRPAEELVTSTALPLPATPAATQAQSATLTPAVVANPLLQAAFTLPRTTVSDPALTAAILAARLNDVASANAAKRLAKSKTEAIPDVGAVDKILPVTLDLDRQGGGNLRQQAERDAALLEDLRKKALAAAVATPAVQPEPEPVNPVPPPPPARA